jgi:hypothetical protein
MGVLRFINLHLRLIVEIYPPNGFIQKKAAYDFAIAFLN